MKDRTVWACILLLAFLIAPAAAPAQNQTDPADEYPPQVMLTGMVAEMAAFLQVVPYTGVDLINACPLNLEPDTMYVVEMRWKQRDGVDRLERKLVWDADHDGVEDCIMMMLDPAIERAVAGYHTRLYAVGEPAVWDSSIHEATGMRRLSEAEREEIRRQSAQGLLDVGSTKNRWMCPDDDGNLVACT